MLENTGIREEVLRELEELALDCGVERVVLFGSRARGDLRGPAILI